jgi:hypothetical protein
MLEESVTVVDFSTGTPDSRRFDRRATIRSRVLPEFAAGVHELFH